MAATASSPRTCPQCHANLSDSQPEAPCPACLMQLGLQAWSAGGGETRTSGGPSRGPSLAGSGGFSMPTNLPDGSELAAHFPQLEILHLVGQGGMGTVYCARQKSLDRLVALKVIKPEARNRARFAERFIREARALAQLNHSHIITVHDFGEAGEYYYFIMEYVDGINLRQMLQGQRLTPRQALEIVPAVCDALQYAHDKGIVHRDIKPENILIDTEGHVKIADFGLAKLLDQQASVPNLTQAHEVMGTMHYMAPEQIEKPLSVDHRADIYSLGVVFYELLTGELPLGRFAPPSQKVQVDIRLDEIVLHTLEKEPSLRYQKASEIKSEVQAFSAHSPNGTQAVRPPASSAAGNRYPASPAVAPMPPLKPAPVKYSPPLEGPGPLPHNGFWGVIASEQTWKNVFYLLLSFPLGIVYFVTLVTGLAAGVGTVIVWVGLLILLGTFLLVRLFCAVERGLAMGLLATPMPRMAAPRDNQKLTILQRAGRLFLNGRTWLGIGYLIVKFPLGIVSFIATVTLIAVPLALLTTVFFHTQPWFEVGILGLQIDRLPRVFIAAPSGVFLLFPFLHLLNGLAWVHAKWARLCLR